MRLGSLLEGPGELWPNGSFILLDLSNEQEKQEEASGSEEVARNDQVQGGQCQEHSLPQKSKEDRHVKVSCQTVLSTPRNSRAVLGREYNSPIRAYHGFTVLCHPTGE